MTNQPIKWIAATAGALFLSLAFCGVMFAEDKKEGLVEVKLNLPTPIFVGTPKDAPKGTTVQPPTGKPRLPLLAPSGTKNVALNKKVTSSDEDPVVGKLDLITDGQKEGTNGSWVELAQGIQWVQIDLAQESTIYGIVLWHSHHEARVYRDVIVQISSDPEFKKDVVTVFNNDQDNSSKMGTGKDYEYFDVAEGKLIDCKLTDPKGIKGRYVRCYSNGNTSDDQSLYTEVEVYGIETK